MHSSRKIAKTEMDNVAINPTTVDPNFNNSNNSNNTTTKKASRLSVKLTLMQRMAVTRITLRYGTLAFKPIKLRKIKTFSPPTVLDDQCVMLYHE